MNVDSNIHHIAGEDLFKKEDARFKEYRESWKRWPETFHAGEFPLFIDIEVTSVCNLRCTFCPSTFRRARIKRGFIRFDLVKKIIDEGSRNNLYGVKFNMRGEPLLHPEIDKFVRYAKDKGLVDVYFNTNAMLLSEDLAKRLIAAGLDRLCISVEGYRKDVYEKHRIGASFKTVLRNIENIQALKRRLGVKYPKIRIQAVLIPDVKTDLEGYRDFWQAKADEISFLDHRDVEAEKKDVAYPWACPQLWQRFAIWWDGTIFPCNQDEEGLIALGNANSITIKEAWNSDRLKRIRGAHKRALAHTISACNICCMRYDEIDREKKGS